MSKNPSRKVTVRKFSKSAASGFYESISRVQWLDLFNDNVSLDTVVEAFHLHILYLYNIFFPTKTIRIRAIEPLWMKNSLKIMINERDRAYLANNKSKFLRLRDEVISHTKYLKSDYLKKAVISGDVKKLWSTFGVLTNKKCKPVVNNISVKHFNEFFASSVQCTLSWLQCMFDFFTSILTAS